MSQSVDPVGSDSAEKAYAAASESAVAKANAAVAAGPATLEFPAKPARDIAVEKAPVAAAPVIAAAAKPQADLVMPAKQPVAKPAVPVAAMPAVAAKKPVVAKQTVSAKKAVAVKAVKPIFPAKIAKIVAPKIKPATKPIPVPVLKSPTLKSKETIMATKQTKDFTATVKTVTADVQAKAKLALAKGSVVLGEAGTFTKGNVEALVTSGKILGTGLQGLGKTYAAEGKSAYETVTADVKELAAVKSPVDFVRLQTSILRRNFDHAFDFGGKNNEAVLKLAGEAFAPIAARASLAVAKVKKAA